MGSFTSKNKRKRTRKSESLGSPNDARTELKKDIEELSKTLDVASGNKLFEIQKILSNFLDLQDKHMREDYINRRIKERAAGISSRILRKIKKLSNNKGIPGFDLLKSVEDKKGIKLRWGIGTTRENLQRIRFSFDGAKGVELMKR
jgi:hypothetical protein